MSLHDRMYELTDVAEVDEFLEQHPNGAFFKAGTCHKTMQGFGYVEQALSAYPEIHVAFVRVVPSRPVSNYIAELTKVVHQSPQLILMKNKQPVFDIDNWDITVEAVNQALVQHHGAKSGPAKAETAKADVSAYKNLLQQYLTGSLSEMEFESYWLRTFRDDATPRSTEQFNLLNSLYGDVDAAISHGVCSLKRQSLKEKAEKLHSLL